MGMHDGLRGDRGSSPVIAAFIQKDTSSRCCTKHSVRRSWNILSVWTCMWHIPGGGRHSVSAEEEGTLRLVELQAVVEGELVVPPQS